VLSLNYRISKAISNNFYKEEGKKTVRQWYQPTPQYIHPLSIAMQLPQVISVNVTGTGVTVRAYWVGAESHRCLHHEATDWRQLLI